MTTITLQCREERTKKNGKAPIIFYIRRKGFKRKAINSGMKIEPKYFDNVTEKFKPGSGDTLKLQTRLDKKTTAIRDYILDNPDATPQMVANDYKGEDLQDFLSYIKAELWMDRKSVSFKTYEQGQYCISLIEKWWGSDAYSFKELSPENLRMFDYTMKANGLGPTTRHHALALLRKYTKRMFASNKIKSNPFDHFKIPAQSKAEKEWTNEEEIERLKAIWEKRSEIPVRLHGTLIHYLHSCHCGLRAVDSRTFSTEQHVEDGFILIQPSKSKHLSNSKLRVPINDYAAYLQKYIGDFTLKQSHSRITEDLRELCGLAEIKKNITFHCARHSFAINSLIKGVPLEVVSKWLGHTSISTTQIYAKIVDSLSGTEMEKWNSKRDILISLQDLGLQDQFDDREEAVAFIKSKLEA